MFLESVLLNWIPYQFKYVIITTEIVIYVSVILAQYRHDFWNHWSNLSHHPQCICIFYSNRLTIFRNWISTFEAELSWICTAINYYEEGSKPEMRVIREKPAPSMVDPTFKKTSVGKLAFDIFYLISLLFNFLFILFVSSFGIKMNNVKLFHTSLF